VLTAFGIANRGVCGGSWGGTLGRAPSEESLDKFTRLSGFSNFTECSREGWTLDIFEGCDIRSVDVAMRAALSPNALYWLRGSS
jgi:hypothetical protein